MLYYLHKEKNMEKTVKIAIVGSRTVTVDNLEEYLPKNVSEIVSGGAKGVDAAAAAYAEKNRIKLTVFLPQYENFGRAAPLKRNEQIADYADAAIAFWDGESKGTRHIIKQFQIRGKPIHIIQVENPSS